MVYNPGALLSSFGHRNHGIRHLISNISRTISQNLNVSRLVLQLYLCNILKPGVESRMKM